MHFNKSDCSLPKLPLASPAKQQPNHKPSKKQWQKAINEYIGCIDD